MSGRFLGERESVKRPENSRGGLYIERALVHSGRGLGNAR